MNSNKDHEEIRKKLSSHQSLEIAERKKNLKKRVTYSTIPAIIISLLVYLTSGGLFGSIVALIITLVLINLYFLMRINFAKAAKIKKIENVFPDFIELVASNLNAGMTLDKSLLLSSRKEFAPLDKEILLLGKDIATGKDIASALKNMGIRIKSEKISKTINLIISGLKSGGNLSILLEEIAGNLRARDFIEKKAASNVLMYVIFIFVAVSMGAPLLFGLSTILVQILTEIITNLPTTTATQNLPFTISKVSISLNFVTYFSIAFIIMINICASLILGLVNKGDEKAGTKYIIPLLAMGLSVYLIIRIFLIGYFKGIFSFI
tara:strand:- start:4357 stop:5319 length:963 start_codon:yes stop_codon:yes gene_type:complete